MENIIRAEQLSRNFGKHTAVNNISLALQSGEIMALLGTNGAGKTTTLRLLVGELIPTQGQVYIDNIDINLQPGKAKQALGYLPDTPPLYQDLTVDEYLTYCGRLHQLSKTKLQQRLAKVKSYCELQNVSRKLIKKLSKGYQQRVGIAQAIIHQPSAIILDEPTNGLDPNQIHEMRDLITDLKSSAGVLLSTHQLAEVEQICDRVQLLKEGKTIFTKDIAALQQAQAIQVRFNETAPITTIQQLDQVTSVKSENSKLIKIYASGDLDALKQELLNLSQQQSWQIIEIFDVHNSLENLFVDEVLREG